MRNLIAVSLFIAIIMTCSAMEASADSGGTIGYKMNLDKEGSLLTIGYKYNNSMAIEYAHQTEETVDYESFKSGSVIFTLPVKPLINPFIKASYNRFSGHDKGSLGFGNAFVVLPNIVLTTEINELGSDKVISTGLRLEF